MPPFQNVKSKLFNVTFIQRYLPLLLNPSVPSMAKPATMTSWCVQQRKPLSTLRVLAPLTAGAPETEALDFFLFFFLLAEAGKWVKTLKSILK